MGRVIARQRRPGTLTRARVVLTVVEPGHGYQDLITGYRDCDGSRRWGHSNSGGRPTASEEAHEILHGVVCLITDGSCQF